MKKTLAAVLAAAMALSTASVAFAKDTLDGVTVLNPDTSSVDRTGIRFDRTYNYILSADVLSSANGDIDPYELGQWVKDGDANVTVTVTEGMSNLKSKPTAKIAYVHAADVMQTTYQWQGFSGTYTYDGYSITAGDEITAIPVDANGNFTLGVSNPTDVKKVVHKGDSDWTKALKSIGSGYAKEVISGSKDTTAPVVQIGFAVAHTYGTGSKDVAMKFRITFKDTVTSRDGYTYSKGDTVMVDEVIFRASYQTMNDIGTEMELTLEECSNAVDQQHVLMNKDGELYDRIGTDEFTVYFENTASFTSRMSPNQKTLNLLYSVDDISDIVDAYPDIDFEFIEFKGQVANATTFVNTGSMSFNAIGGNETTVYEFVDGELTKLDGTFNKIADTIDVKGIKKLTTYVIAERELPEEEEPEESSEPASSAPVVEDDNNGNPNTGAC